MADPTLYVDFLVALLIPTFAVLYSSAKADRVALMTAHAQLLDRNPATMTDEEQDQVYWISGLGSREAWALAGIAASIIALAFAMFETAIGIGIPSQHSFPFLLVFMFLQVGVLLWDERRSTSAWVKLQRRLYKQAKPGWARKLGPPRFK